MPRKRRGRGEGSIRQRADGTWEARVSFGTVGGKPMSKSVYAKTKAEAQKKLRDLQIDAGKGAALATSASILGDFLDTWLADAKLLVGETTYLRYEQLARLHIKPHVGTIRLDKFTPQHVSFLVAQIGKANDSPASKQRKSVALLRAVFKSAVRLRLVAANPVDGIPLAKVPPKEIQILTDAEVAEVLRVAKPYRIYSLIALALGSGMRQGELLALKWIDLDVEKEVVQVRRSLAEVGGVFRVKEPKSASGRRSVKIPSAVVDALQAHRVAMSDEAHGSEFMFTTRTGNHISKSNLNRDTFAPIIKAAGVERIRFHDLRHSHASALLRAGVNPKAISRRLGHSSVEFTMRVYCHLLPDADEASASAASKLFDTH